MRAPHAQHRAEKFLELLSEIVHSLIPSGDSTYSAAGETILKLFTGSDHFGYSVRIPAGSSKIETGITPAHPVDLQWETFTDAANEAGAIRSNAIVLEEHEEAVKVWIHDYPDDEFLQRYAWFMQFEMPQLRPFTFYFRANPHLI